MPGLRSSTSRSRFATRSPSGPMYSVFLIPAACLAPAAPPPPAAGAAAAPTLLLPALRCMLSPRGTAGGLLPTAVPAVHCTVLARRLAAVVVLPAYCALLPGPGPASDRGTFRAHAGIRSSGLLPCNFVERRRTAVSLWEVCQCQAGCPSCCRCRLSSSTQSYKAHAPFQLDSGLANIQSSELQAAHLCSWP